MKIIINKHSFSKLYLNIQKIVLLAFLFFYIYSVPLRYLPWGIGTRMIFALFGIILIFVDIFKNLNYKSKINIHYRVLYGSLLLLTILTISMITMLVNSSIDIALIKYSLSLILIFVAGYSIMRLFKLVYNIVSFTKISNYIIVVILLQIILAALMFFIPIVRTNLYAIQNMSAFDMQISEQVVEFRLIGFGSAFFGAGIANGYALMLIATMLKRKETKPTQVFFYSLAFFLILSLGMMMARVTIIGGILAIILLLFPVQFPKFKPSRKVYSFFLYLILIPILFLSTISFFSEENRNKVELAINYGFELFVNYKNEGQFRTASSDELKESYTFPAHFKTYLIGDGYFADPNSPNDSYYMGVDAGYLRLIYYFGVFGLLTFFIFQLNPIIFSLRINDRVHKFFFILSFVYLLILNAKGFTDILPFSILFCFTQNTPLLIEYTKK